MTMDELVNLYLEQMGLSRQFKMCIRDRIHTTQFRLGTRLSWNEVIVRQTFDKVSMGSDFPIVGIDVVAGLKDILNGDYEYYRLELSVKHDFDIAPIGYSDIMLSGGKIFNKVPYPLLKLHEGCLLYTSWMQKLGNRCHW